jgi:pimeloyl-ACP methyl ester carboxylesterase
LIFYLDKMQPKGSIVVECGNALLKNGYKVKILNTINFKKSMHYRVTCPVTIVCGEKDSANLKASKKLKELLPQATLQIVHGAGHEINKDAPEVIAAILNNIFFRE